MIGFADNKTRRGARLTANLFDELVVDNFAGGGGASMGIEAAIGRAVDLAVNHDQHSVEMHRLNHPHTRHLCEDVWDVDPLEATAGRPVGLAWFSPDCRHFSRAKGGKPVQKKIRGLAWIVVKWAKMVKPRVIILENVREFQEWGPLTAESKPCPNRKGTTFKRWRKQLENLGYATDCRVLNAADYGAPTHRRRFFLIARCDGQPIHWPEPTHGPGRRPYRTAAQCIDWAIPCPSIFLTKAEARPLGVIRPLAEKTMRRIAMGLKRYVLDNPKPFIVTCNHSGPEFRGQGTDEPFKTVTGSRDAHGVVTPYVTRCAHGDGADGTARWGHGHQDLQEPLPTLTASKDFAVTAPLLVEVQNGSSEAGHRSVDRPAHTVTANPKGGGMALAAPHLVKFRGECNGADVQQPLPTITAGAGSVRPAGAAHAMGVAAPFLVQRYGEAPGQETRGQGADAPILTVTPANNSGNLVTASLTKYHGQKGNESCAKSPDEPLPTVDTSNRFGLVSAFLGRYYGQSVGQPPTEPAPTQSTVDHTAVVAGHLLKNNHGSHSVGAEEPLHTVTTGGRHGVITSHLSHMNHGQKQWSDVRDPLRTITAGGYHAAEVRAFLVKYFGSGGQGQTCDQPLHTVTGNDRFGLVKIDGADYQIADIGLRMLSPRELLNAQFGRFAKGYILTGTKSQQVARIGNSVCPELAEVLVRANYAEKAEAAA